MKGRGSIAAPSLIILHILEGKRDQHGKYEWFNNPNAKVSSHYIIFKDGTVVQKVLLKDTAYHCRGYNQRSIGIEIEGFANDPTWLSEDVYTSLALLIKFIAPIYHIPIDRKHIKGHSEMPGHGGNSDMGKYFSWGKLFKLLT